MDFKNDIDVLARTIYGEARGECREGRQAVACVVLNRIKKRNQSGFTEVKGFRLPSIAATCLKPYQFSCWLENDPNRVKIETVDCADAVFRDCLEIASAAVKGGLPDITLGATHYYNPEVCRCPDFARGKEPCVVIGSHYFFNNID